MILFMPTQPDPTLARHPIRVVSERTGVNPNLLRAWERRYDVVEPGRSEGGQRLYSDEDIERIFLLRRVSDGGRAISQIAGMSNEELAGLMEEDEAAREEREAAYLGSSALGRHVRDAMDAVESLDPIRLEQILRREVVALGADRFLEELVTPVLTTIGERWREGRIRPAHEHVAVAVIKQVLGWMLERARSGTTGPTIVIGTLTGERHELGALLAATASALSGWKVVFMGEDLPPEEIALAVRSLNAAAVGVSVVNPLDWEALPAQLRQLLDELPEGVPLLLGGAAAAETARIVADVRIRGVSSLVQLRGILHELASEADGGRKAG